MWKPSFFYCRIRIERWIVQCRLERPEETGTKEITKLSTVLFDSNEETNNELNDWIILALLIMIFVGLIYQFIRNMMATCVCGRSQGQVTEEYELTVKEEEEDDCPRRRPRQRDP